MMAIFTALMLVGSTPVLPVPGFLTVNSQPVGMTIFVDGDSIGITPIERYQMTPGRYLVTVVSNDSLESLYWRLRNGGVSERLSALWALAGIDAGSTRVEVFPGMETKVEIESRLMERSVRQAKWVLGGTVFGLFGLGLLMGVVIGMVVD